MCQYILLAYSPNDASYPMSQIVDIPSRGILHLIVMDPTELIVEEDLE